MNVHGRLSGILLPLFSLRSKHDVGVGDFAALDGLFGWMQASRQKLLMLLPLLPTAAGDTSPYSTRSAFGLNPLFIHLGWLPEGVVLTEHERQVVDEARASPSIRYELVNEVKSAALERAFKAFEAQGASARSRAFDEWCHQNAHWLDTYALYTSLSESNGRRPWWEWPGGVAAREPKAVDEAKGLHKRRIRYHQWLQWVADTQWTTVRSQAKARGILLCGDEPFIIGQDWGLPWFDFDALEASGDAWLRARARHAAQAYDVRRVDHAIGYFRQYIRDEKAPKGRFVPDDEPGQVRRGERNFRLLSEGAGIVAEDLGVIPRFARDTLARLGLPGYQVMRWSREDGVYRDPRHYPEVSLATTGTHDTETMRQWWETMQGWEREAICKTWPELWRFNEPVATFTPEVHEALVQAALNSASAWCCLPWQDVFGEAERVNTPGTVGSHNWTWRIGTEVEELLTHEPTRRAAEWLSRLTHEGRRA